MKQKIKLCTIFTILLGVCMFVPVKSAKAYTSGNSTIQTAKSINVNTIYTDNVASEDTHYYKFTISQAGKVSVNFSHGNLTSDSRYWEMWIYTSNKDELIWMESRGVETNKTSCEVGLKAGTYYLCICESYYESNADYTFKINYSASAYWESELNNSVLDADSISVNKKYYGAIQSGQDDQDWYTFTISKPGKVSINFKHNNLTSDNRYWELWIYTVNNDELVWMESSGTDIDKTTSSVGLSAGTYYVKISEGYYENNSNYNFQVNYTASNVWEQELNDAVSQVNTVKTNIRYYGAIQDGKDEADWYKFTISKAGKVNINFKHTNLTSDTRYWEMWIYTINNEELLWMESYGTETSKTSCNVGLAAGTYYVKISEGYYQNDAEYSFALNYKASNTCESELNNDISSADSIQLNKNYYGAIQCGQDNDDWYKLKLSGKKKVRITLQHKNITEDTRYWEVRLYNASSNEIVFLESYGNETNKSSETITLKKGTYYIKVSEGYYHSDADYTLMVTDRPAKVSGVKMSSSRKSIKISWNKVSGTKYVIAYSTSKAKLKKIKDYSTAKTSGVKIVSSSKNAKTIKKLKKGNRYYVKVCAYRKVKGKKYCGKWSKVNSIKVK